MKTIPQTLVSTLLCGVILLGHVPAWLHVSTCGEHGIAAHEVASLEDSTERPADCCDGARCEVDRVADLQDCPFKRREVRMNRSAGTEVTSVQLVSCGGPQQHLGCSHEHSEHPSGDPAHDHDRCVVCQSLSGDLGPVVTISPVLSGTLLLESSLCGENISLRDGFIAIERTRGPPMV